MARPAIHKKVNKVCYCGNEFITTEKRIESNRGQFCSKQCWYKTKKGKPSWNKGKKCPSIRRSKLGSKNPMWNGGIIIRSGYFFIKANWHPNKNRGGYVALHRLIIEQKLNRFLTRKENIHHINGNKQDNRPENLEILSSSEHIRLHRKQELLEGKKLFGRK